MSGRDVCLVAGTVAVCGIFGYLWTKRQTGLIATPAALSHSNSSSCNSAQHIPENAEEDARLDSDTSSKSEEQNISSLNCYDLEEDRVPVGRQLYNAIILHTSKDETAARICQQTLRRQINVQNLRIGFPDNIIMPGTSVLDGLGSLLSNSRLVIIFHSKYLSMDGLMLFGKQTNIKQSLEDPQKRDRIIPFVVDDEDISVDISTIQTVDYVKDIRSAKFTSFKDKMERLFLKWRKKIA